MLVTSKRHPLFSSVKVNYYFFDTISAERLASGSILYHLIRKLLHQHSIDRIRIRNLPDMRRTLYPLGHRLLIVPVWAPKREI